jgi:hypothetical protein
VTPSCASRPETKSNFASSSANNNVAIGRSERGEMTRREIEWEKLKKKEEKERKEEVNRKIASQKAISVILRREATKAVIEKKRGSTNSKKLLPQTVLEALHERITSLRWASALEVVQKPDHNHQVLYFTVIVVQILRANMVNWTNHFENSSMPKHTYFIQEGQWRIKNTVWMAM